MEKEHYIEWIELLSENKVQRVHLSPGQAPEAVFYTNETDVYAREYCNVHGHWRSK
jgi:superoxide reductase